MRLSPRTLTLPLLASALLVAGCSSGGGSSADGGSGGSASPSPSGSPSASASASSSPSAGASDPAGSPAASPGTDGLPGGTAGREELSDGWLDDQGRLFYGEAAPPEKKQQALCSYLFGTPAEVGRTARLKGTVTLAPQSGYAVLGSNGVGFQCGYAVGGTTTFSLVAWSKQLDGSTGKALHLVEARLSRGGFGYSAYAPAYKGATMSDATAKRWLELAGTRVRGS